MSGATIAQAIPIAISPILTRIYTPEDFGVFALYMSVVSIISIIATGKYDLAIMLPRKDKDAMHIAALAIGITCTISLLLFIMVFLFNNQITGLLGYPELSPWLYLLPFTVLLTGVYQSLNYWSIRKKYYKRLSLNKIVQSGATGMSNIGIGIGSAGFSGGLILGGFSGQMLATGVLARTIYNKERIHKNDLDKIRIYALAKTYKKFPVYFTFIYGLNAFSSSIVPILLATTFGINVAGQYYLVMRSIKGPLGIISSSVGNVFFQKATHGNNCYSMYIKISVYLFLIGIIPTLIFFFYGKDIFTFVFGEKWQIAGEMSSILIIMLFLSFVTIPVSQLSTIKQKTTYNIIWQLILLLGIYVSLGVGKLVNDWYYFILLVATVQSLLYCYGYFYEMKLCMKKE